MQFFRFHGIGELYLVQVHITADDGEHKFLVFFGPFGDRGDHEHGFGRA